MSPRTLHRRPHLLIHEGICSLIILAMSVMPLAWGLALQGRKLDQTRRQAVLMEVIDGELEWLQAGFGLDIVPGTYPGYRPAGEAVSDFDGTFALVVTEEAYTLRYQRQDGLVLIAESVPRQLPELAR